MLMGLFEANGYHVTHDSDDPQGEIVVVNTCGFINDAKEESINTILEFAQAKTEGRFSFSSISSKNPRCIPQRGS